MSLQLIRLLAPAFAVTAVLAGIHVYLGLRIFERGAIFAGLALPQMAALGTTVALFLGRDIHGAISFLWSAAFAVIGAAVFAFARQRRIPAEAIAGIVYAVAAAATMLVMNVASQDTAQLEDVLAGNVLAAGWRIVVETAVLYGAIGLFHYVFRGKFVAASRLWDFLFYASFGVVVAWSVAVAGILLVFCYLIIPPAAARLFARSIGKRVALGWIIAAAGSAAGILLSFGVDLPTGATIVCTFGLAILLMAVARLFVRNGTRTA